MITIEKTKKYVIMYPILTPPLLINIVPLFTFFTSLKGMFFSDFLLPHTNISASQNCTASYILRRVPHTYQDTCGETYSHRFPYVIHVRSGGKNLLARPHRHEMIPALSVFCAESSRKFIMYQYR